MAITLDATVGGASSNAYVDVAAADAYFEARLKATAWTGEDVEDQKKALIMATARLEQESWQGLKADSDQALAWPRHSTYDLNGDVYDDDAIPEPVATATYELALKLLGESDPFGDSGLEGFEQIKVGPLAVVPRHSKIAGELPEHVRREIRHLLETPSSATVRMFRA